MPEAYAMIDTDRLLAVMPAEASGFIGRIECVHISRRSIVSSISPPRTKRSKPGEVAARTAPAQRAGREHGDGRRGVAPRGAEGLRERARVEGEHAAALAPPAGVDQVVGAAEELIQVGGEAPAARIFTRRGEVGRGLAVQLRQLAEVAGRERADVAALARRDQCLEPRPVRFPFLHPVHGESR